MPRPHRTGRAVALDGIILLDKPEGLSSNSALQKVRRALGAAKAGHAGTLDPLATGMLPVLLGEATKLAGHLLHGDKAYSVGCRLGQSTTTYDAEGEVVEALPVPALDAAAVGTALVPFTGRIRQRPPVYSAIKRGGQPLYRLARRGEAVEVPEREVEIHAVRVLAVAGDRVDLEVECGSGTYIRSLVHDLGRALGCGAHVVRLRRLWVEPFRAHPLVTLDEVEAGRAAPLPLEVAVKDWPWAHLDPGQVALVRQGRVIQAAVHPGRGDTVAGLDGEGRLVALLQVGQGGMLQPKRVINPA